jgi:hypothetical protein
MTIIVIFFCACVTMKKTMVVTIAFFGGFVPKKAMTCVGIII